MNGEIMKFVICSRSQGSCFGNDGGLHKAVKMRVGEGLRNLSAKNIMFKERSVSCRVKKG